MASCTTAQLSLVSHARGAFHIRQSSSSTAQLSLVSHPWNAVSPLPNILQTGDKQMSMLIQLRCWTGALAEYTEKISGKLVCQVGVTTLP